MVPLLLNLLLPLSPFPTSPQFLRGLAQRCPSPRMRTLISIGGQHRGIYGLPVCGQMDDVTSGLAFAVCDAIRSFVSFLTRLPIIRSYSVQAQYWHDPHDPGWGKQRYNFIGKLDRTVRFSTVLVLKNVCEYPPLKSILNDFIHFPMISPFIQFIHPFFHFILSYLIQ